MILGLIFGIGRFYESHFINCIKRTFSHPYLYKWRVLAGLNVIFIQT